MAAFVAELQRWGRRINLVGSIDIEAIKVHVTDSLAAAAALPRGATVVDLGSGAGFPGIPIAIARPDLSVTLVEIRERRVHFLRHVVRALGLSVRVLRCDIGDPTDDGFDIAVVRAVAAFPGVLILAEPWLAAEGECWIWTREDAASHGLEGARELRIGDGRERGRIVQVSKRMIPRGTHLSKIVRK